MSIYYVSDRFGDDTETGLTRTQAKETIQAGIAAAFAAGGGPHTIYIWPGTYTHTDQLLFDSPVSLSLQVDPFAGVSGSPVILSVSGDAESIYVHTDFGAATLSLSNIAVVQTYAGGSPKGMHIDAALATVNLSAFKFQSTPATQLVVNTVAALNLNGVQFAQPTTPSYSIDITTCGALNVSDMHLYGNTSGNIRINGLATGAEFAPVGDAAIVNTSDGLYPFKVNL